MTTDRPFRVAIVGAGPQGTSVALRLAARAGRAGGRPIHLHVFEPHEPGAGLTWRADQPPELLMNSPAGSAQPLPAGPDGTAVPPFRDWLRDRPELGSGAPECAGYAPRASVGAYLAEAFRRLSDGTAGVRVVVHRTRARRLLDATSGWGSQLVEVEGGPPVPVDAVVLTQGHLPVGPAPPERELAASAERQGWCYLPTGPADADLAARLRPGRRVAVRGFGLTAVDLVALLTQGRGGRFVDRPGDRLRYLPSGGEPIIYIGSRTGLPYRAKPPIGGPLIEPPPTDLLTGDATRGWVPGSVDLRAQVWPLIHRAVLTAYARELRRPGRWVPAAPPMDRGDRRPVDAGAGTDPVVGPVGPDRHADIPTRGFPTDGFPTAGFPTDGFPTAGFPADWWMTPTGLGRPADVAAAVRRDLAQPLRPDFPARLAARAAFIQAAGTVAALDAAGIFADESVARDVMGWFETLSCALTSGPPRGRLRQLLALFDAGVVRFVGSGMRAVPAGAGIVVSGSAQRQPVVVDGLVDARLPVPDLCRTRDPLVRALLRDGGGYEVVVGQGTPHVRHTGALAVDSGFRLLDRTGRPHPGRWAAGPSVRVAVITRAGWDGAAEPVDPAEAVARGVLESAGQYPADVFASASGRASGLM